jgi:hypothetical protein
MGFHVVQGSPQNIWARVDGTEILYVGQIVTGSSDGVLPMTGAVGGADTTGKAVPFGVVVGTNRKTPVSDTTANSEYITGVVSQAGQIAVEKGMVEGIYSKRETSAMVEVAVIDPSTYIYGPIYNAGYGAIPTVQTITTIQADGMLTAETWSNADAASFVADESTIHMRTGLNTGLQRIGINTSRTAPQVIHAFPYDNTTSDTGLQVPIREIGTAKLNFDDESTYIDVAHTYTTNYYVVEVIKLDLSVAGKEHCIFRFGMDQFALLRA